MVLTQHSQPIGDTGKARGKHPLLLDMAAFETVALRSAVDPIGQLEESMTLFHFIAQLPPRQMAVMVLLHAHGLSTAQAAAELGITPASVRSNARHAMRRMHQKLGLDALTIEEGHTDDVAH